MSHEVKSAERDDIKAQRDAIRAGDIKAGASPWRNRSVEENLELFKKMRAGVFDVTKTNENIIITWKRCSLCVVFIIF